MTTEILIGDCIEQMRGLPDGSVDAVVTDPPYELGFMGKKWDASGIAYNKDMWKECFRLLKPGGHLLSFGGSRTYHRMACAIEDAGWEIRDQIMWVYGSGFPKSLNVGKSVDKALGETGTFGDYKSKDHAIKRKPGNERMHEGYQRPWRNDPKIEDRNARQYLPSSLEGKQWHGFGTALKPAHEPICLARKPLIGTVAENVLKHGCGALNIDGCRIGTEKRTYNGGGASQIKLNNHGKGDTGIGYMDESGKEKEYLATGRWPANFCHDGSEEVVQLFPNSNGQAGIVKGTEPSQTGGNGTACYGKYGRVAADKRGDSGSAARFFFCAKASKFDRDYGLEGMENVDRRAYSGPVTSDPRMEHEQQRLPSKNHHPTVKPHNLMRWLCRLITPPGGIILDPFMGSGSTGKAAIREGFSFIGIELDPEYAEIARKRIEAVKYVPKAKVLPRYRDKEEVRRKPEQMELFT